MIWLACLVGFLTLAYFGTTAFLAVVVIAVAVTAFTHGMRWQRRTTRRALRGLR